MPIRDQELKPRISLNFLRKLLGEPDLGPDVLPQPLGPVNSHHKPELEGAEPPAQGNVPVPVVRDFALVLVLEVKGIHIESIHNLSEQNAVILWPALILFPTWSP